MSLTPKGSPWSGPAIGRLSSSARLRNGVRPDRCDPRPHLGVARGDPSRQDLTSVSLVSVFSRIRLSRRLRSENTLPWDFLFAL